MKFPKLFSKKMYVYRCPDCDNVVFKSTAKDIIILDVNKKKFIYPNGVIPNNHKPGKPESPNLWLIFYSFILYPFYFLFPSIPRFLIRPFSSKS